jgi:hypothetical protein
VFIEKEKITQAVKATPTLIKEKEPAVHGYKFTDRVYRSYRYGGVHNLIKLLSLCEVERRNVKVWSCFNFDEAY